LSTEPSAVQPDREDTVGLTATLSAIVAHELNNISVPLQGFHDIAGQSGSSVELLKQCLDEMRIGLARLNGLSTDLESLSETVSNRVPTAIRDCTVPPDHRLPDYSGRVRWLCEPSLTVLVDPGHARRATASLARVSNASIEFVNLERGAEIRCSGCDQTLSPALGFVSARTQGTRAAGSLALRDPFDPTVKSHGARRLTIAALAHCAHHAGGHVIADQGTSTLSLLFPVA
jgi:hypothetical protein